MFSLLVLQGGSRQFPSHGPDADDSFYYCPSPEKIGRIFVGILGLARKHTPAVTKALSIFYQQVQKARDVIARDPAKAASIYGVGNLTQAEQARRKPTFWPIRKPGDLVQLDTKEIRPQRGVVLKHFSARDMVSRWYVVEVHERATSLAAAHLLDTLVDRMPFPIAALQVDGGSEFAAEFETACQQRGLPLFVLPPRSPKLNGQVERSHRTHHEEFYQVIPDRWNVGSLNPQLRRWEHIYNTVRPHQALGYQTPLEFLQRCRSQSLKAECH